MSLLNTIQSVLARLSGIEPQVRAIQKDLDHLRQAIGRVEDRQLRAEGKRTLRENEYKVYSQWGEDGIFQFLLRQIKVSRPVFVEFGVEKYVESNTRFLLVNNQWSGLVMDGSAKDIAYIKNDSIYWRHNLKAVQAFVTRENINDLLQQNGVSGSIGLLSIDIDGNDYWVWEEIQVVQPDLLVVEYNARFGAERAVTVPYDPQFVRSKAHHSCIYYGASLAAFVSLGKRKGYAFVGCNSAGNNAFFVRKELRPETLPELSAAQGYVACQFRETRDAAGALLFSSPEEEAQILAKLPLVEVG